MQRFLIASLFSLSLASADLKPGPLFTSEMVLQRDMENRIWGWDQAGQKVSVSFGEHKKETIADESGRWEVKFPALESASQGRSLTLSGSTEVVLENVLVGDVWLCAGQSNMQWLVKNSNDPDLVKLTAKNKAIRQVIIPRIWKGQEQQDVKAQWTASDSSSVGNCSAVGYHFGRIIHEVTGIPIGLVNCAWGGSSAETWISRDTFAKDPQWKTLQKNGDKNFQAWSSLTGEQRKAWKYPRIQQMPSLAYNGMVHPIEGFSIKGVIWYQGEANSSRAEQYQRLFPLLIQEWREKWNQGDFPFYWVQLADFGSKESDGTIGSKWAELREAQTMTLKLPNTGQAVIHDLGEGNDVHPRNKRDVAERLVRWALAKNYGKKITYRSPSFSKVEYFPGKVVLTFKDVGPGLKSYDLPQLQGFVIAGGDQKFRVAKAAFKGADQIVIEHPTDQKIVAVRYAWGDNPICNIVSKNGLPLNSFRTDTFPLVTAGKE